jgi:hypothetical protein
MKHSRSLDLTIILFSHNSIQLCKTPPISHRSTPCLFRCLPTWLVYFRCSVAWCFFFDKCDLMLTPQDRRGYNSLTGRLDCITLIQAEGYLIDWLWCSTWLDSFFALFNFSHSISQFQNESNVKNDRWMTSS